MKSIAYLLFLCWLPLSVYAQIAPPADTGQVFEYLQQFHDLKIVMETDLKTLRDNTAEPHWQPAVFKIMQGEQIAWQTTLKVKPRGQMRRKNCDFPPLKLRFPTEDPKNDSLEDAHELKVVMACHREKDSELLVLKEYMAYQLYNVLTEQSFQAKLAQVEFKDPKHRMMEWSATAFFIEPERCLATRMEGRPYKAASVRPGSLDTAAYLQFAIFQFMIGNTDWWVYSRHNLKVIASKKTMPIPVPYDFDYAGIVDAPYAQAAPDYHLGSVRDRYFLGPCYPEAAYLTAIERFKQKKAVLLRACRILNPIAPGIGQEMADYLTDFFTLLDDPRRVQKEIIRHCDKAKKPPKL